MDHVLATAATANRRIADGWLMLDCRSHIAYVTGVARAAREAIGPA